MLTARPQSCLVRPRPAVHCWHGRGCAAVPLSSHPPPGVEGCSAAGVPQAFGTAPSHEGAAEAAPGKTAPLAAANCTRTRIHTLEHSSVHHCRTLDPGYVSGTFSARFCAVGLPDMAPGASGLPVGCSCPSGTTFLKAMAVLLEAAGSTSMHQIYAVARWWVVMECLWFSTGLYWLSAGVHNTPIASPCCLRIDIVSPSSDDEESAPGEPWRLLCGRALRSFRTEMGPLPQFTPPLPLSIAAGPDRFNLSTIHAACTR